MYESTRLYNPKALISSLDFIRSDVEGRKDRHPCTGLAVVLVRHPSPLPAHATIAVAALSDPLRQLLPDRPAPLHTQRQLGRATLQDGFELRVAVQPARDALHALAEPFHTRSKIMGREG